MMLMLFIPLVLVAWFVMALALRTEPDAAATVSAKPRLDAGLDVLRERYVRGEIDRDEYQWRALEFLTR